MSVIVTDTGFAREDWAHGFSPLSAHQAQDRRGLDLSPDTDPASLLGRLGGIGMIRVDFPSFADGRGFTIARQLRLMGFTGRLRAAGHVISDQYAMARRAGFDEVEISKVQSLRQPEAHWRFRADWRAYDHQSRLRG
ncbi:DUF934 domain-containing protein [Aliiroseovarius subalbicans]|uniref:DUF934 domain-containing protein n=1 Tax=Aliiroseovarius subalbicans TaxID=2925840 RepID=UPI001F5A8A85|nr:DUF934 domain-containing protein [Aliiroseovarius subalbicans]MCI2398835.1 DUF934 domain-containing protein [Aliiroseovarius subalbicans]